MNATPALIASKPRAEVGHRTNQNEFETPVKSAWERGADMSEGVTLNPVRDEIRLQPLEAKNSTSPPATKQLRQNAELPSAIPPGVRLYLPETASPHWLTEARDRAKFRWNELRGQAQRGPREYPAQTLLAFAGVAFATGIMLRIWRSEGD